jgi:hypothetical protein
MSIDQLAHADSLELLAMFHAAHEIEDTMTPEEIDEMEREMISKQ